MTLAEVLTEIEKSAGAACIAILGVCLGLSWADIETAIEHFVTGCPPVTDEQIIAFTAGAATELDYYADDSHLCDCGTCEAIRHELGHAPGEVPA
ncbi:hypothetical protein [[Mycobacterium] crassicus]|uniref:Uncharacterized protein n=1 Tax=[Mycobacterium] crassicus TaxID=2872309 RepID=A0ABU5XG76_9MYCO|nr:hypothetical protein [Mycolicibacter sp. MYC098]MEB3021291.1 hypothetical protein [Mycolicibacter sp. MYC098]